MLKGFKTCLKNMLILTCCLIHCCYIFLCFISVLFCCADAEQSRVLRPEATFYTIDGLQQDEAVVIGVATIVDQRVGEAVTLSARTNPSTSVLSGLRITEISSQRIRITWSSFSRATEYKIIWRREDGKKSFG